MRDVFTLDRGFAAVQMEDFMSASKTFFGGKWLRNLLHGAVPVDGILSPGADDERCQGRASTDDRRKRARDTQSGHERVPVRWANFR